jgi:hypothetical protein
VLFGQSILIRALPEQTVLESLEKARAYSVVALDGKSWIVEFPALEQRLLLPGKGPYFIIERR